MKIQVSSFGKKISKKPEQYEHTASFFKDFYLKDISLNLAFFYGNAIGQFLKK